MIKLIGVLFLILFSLTGLTNKYERIKLEEIKSIRSIKIDTNSYDEINKKTQELDSILLQINKKL